MRVEIIMTCTHVRLFHAGHCPPTVGQRIYCFQCSDMKVVTGGPGDYRAICNMCTGLYATRKSPDAIRRVVVKHLTRNPDHTVKVWQIGLPDVHEVSLPQGGILAGFDSADTLPLHS